MTEYLGTLCPSCGTETINPRAQHVRFPDGTVLFRNIVHAVLLTTCVSCKENDGSQRDPQAHQERQGRR